MTARDFCYWLQGLFELGSPTALDAKQTDLVKRHLALVFKHEIDPNAGPAEHQAVLDQIHAGLKQQAAQEAGPPKIGGAGPGGLLYRC